MSTIDAIKMQEREQNLEALASFFKQRDIPLNEALDLACIMLIKTYCFSSPAEQHNLLTSLGCAMAAASKLYKKFDLDYYEPQTQEITYN